MVFCGRPSKACQRCRDRRLKCDLRSGSCSQCIRADAICAGYRDTQQLRIKDESQAVRTRMRNGAAPEPRTLALSLDFQARDAFFNHYVMGASKTWDFLEPFHDPTRSPEHLKLSIDAVSLAYFSHQIYSTVALDAARARYVSALRMTNKALQSPEVAAEDTTLLTSLILDLFEKITNNGLQHDEAWRSHVNGALALVRLRGLGQFRDPSAARVLGRLSTNFLINCVASDTRVPDELNELRAHVGELLHLQDPKWRLSDLMVHYANLRNDIRTGQLLIDQCVKSSLELDARFQALALDMPSSWQYKTTTMNQESENIYKCRFDSYPDRHTTQTWNVLRLVRILLNEFVLEYSLAFTEDVIADGSLLATATKDNIETLACQICASVPQYVECSGAARSTFSNLQSSTLWEGIGKRRARHALTPSQNLDCYTLIFPLFVCGRSRGSPNGLKQWTIRQLHYMGSHFGIRNAELVGQILEQGTDVNPWAVYAMLGSYAFAA